jgi:hypothetical protein
LFLLLQVGQTWLTLKTLYGSWLDSVMADFDGENIMDGGIQNGMGKMAIFKPVFSLPKFFFLKSDQCC